MEGGVYSLTLTSLCSSTKQVQTEVRVQTTDTEQAMSVIHTTHTHERSMGLDAQLIIHIDVMWCTFLVFLIKCA